MEKTELEILVDCKRYCEAKLNTLYKHLDDVEDERSGKFILNNIRHLEKVLGMEESCNEKA